MKKKDNIFLVVGSLLVSLNLFIHKTPLLVQSVPLNWIPRTSIRGDVDGACHRTKLDRQYRQKKGIPKNRKTRNEDGIFCVLCKDPDLISK